MQQHDRSQIAELAHLYVDGAFDRRELLRRVAFVTGSLAAATMALEAVGLPAPAAVPECDPCPADVRVPEDAADLEVLHQVQFPGAAGPLFAHQARPRHAQPLPESYVYGGEVGDNFGPVTVPEDEYFMMGDNRYQSCDSREWGSVPRENLIGPVFARYWPIQRIGFQ